MDEFAAQEDFLISVGPNKQKILAEIIATKKPAVLVELGGYIGYSAILFADAMSRAGVKSPVVWTLEASQEYADIAAKFVDLAGLSHIVKIIVGPAEESLRRLKSDGVLGQGIDVLFLDHVEDLYEHDLKVCEELELLKAGSVILADNALRPGAPEYVKYVRAHPGLDSHGIESLIIPGEFEVCDVVPHRDCLQLTNDGINVYYVGRNRIHSGQMMGRKLVIPCCYSREGTKMMCIYSESQCNQRYNIDRYRIHGKDFLNTCHLDEKAWACQYVLTSQPWEYLPDSAE